VRSADDAWAGALLEELTGRFGWDVPCVWSVSINLLQSPAVYRVMMRHEARLSLSALLRAPVTDRPPLAAAPAAARGRPTALPARRRARNPAG
jgi:hypothetical protein